MHSIEDQQWSENFVSSPCSDAIKENGTKAAAVDTFAAENVNKVAINAELPIVDNLNSSSTSVTEMVMGALLCSINWPMVTFYFLAEKQISGLSNC